MTEQPKDEISKKLSAISDARADYYSKVGELSDLEKQCEELRIKCVQLRMDVEAKRKNLLSLQVAFADSFQGK